MPASVQVQQGTCVPCWGQGGAEIRLMKTICLRCAKRSGFLCKSGFTLLLRKLDTSYAALAGECTRASRCRQRVTCCLGHFAFWMSVSHCLLLI